MTRAWLRAHALIAVALLLVALTVDITPLEGWALTVALLVNVAMGTWAYLRLRGGRPAPGPAGRAGDGLGYSPARPAATTSGKAGSGDERAAGGARRGRPLRTRRLSLPATDGVVAICGAGLPIGELRRGRRKREVVRTPVSEPPETPSIAPPEPDDAKTALREALVGVQPTDTEIQVIRWLEAQPADRLAFVVALLERVREAGCTEGCEDSGRGAS